MLLFGFTVNRKVDFDDLTILTENFRDMDIAIYREYGCCVNLHNNIQKNDKGEF